MKSFEPELGQMAFGNAYSEYTLNNKTEEYLAERLFSLAEKLGEESPVYGVEFKNPVFEMHRYYWGDDTCGYEELEEQWMDIHAHSPQCYQTELKELEEKYGGVAWMESNPNHRAYEKELSELLKKYGLPSQGSAVHCTCGYRKEWTEFVEHNGHKEDCPIVLPNFRCGELVVRWYKVIGRSMSVDKIMGKDEIKRLFDLCENSLEKV